MKIIRIKLPTDLVTVPPNALSTYHASDLVIRTWGGDTSIKHVDVAYTPEHHVAIYVWRVTRTDWSDPVYVWSDKFGEVGIADETGTVQS